MKAVIRTQLSVFNYHATDLKLIRFSMPGFYCRKIGFLSFLKRGAKALRHTGTERNCGSILWE
ncbi:MAG: hypothetical protein A2Y13_03780 [Planctomycetes bacterium GWC2_45_44]|nr:MAG: hypothetical protein A2Y13_03780 [Planctomycetes bacterium GWC2_45_44]HBR20460.1 hypothetical protein [Phycisphaerales bacterium]